MLTHSILRLFPGGYEDDEGYDADVDATEKGSKGRKKKKSIQKPFNLPGSIAMIVRDMEQKPHAVQYEQLDEEQQRQVCDRCLYPLLSDGWQKSC